MKKLLPTLILSAAALALLAGCSQQTADNNAPAEKKELVLGGSSMPYGIVFEKGIKPIMEKKGYTIKTMNFSTLDVNNQAVNNGEVDFNLDQHTAYINVYNKNKNTHLMPLVHTPLIPAAIYSEKYKAFDQAPNGATVLIPNDASNTTRALRILAKANLITFKASANKDQLTPQDIDKNTKNLKIKEMDSVIIPRALADSDFGSISGGIAYQSKVDPKKIVVREDVAPEMEMTVAINEKNKDTQWAKDLKEAYQSQEFKDFMNTFNKDGMWVMPKG